MGRLAMARLAERDPAAPHDIDEVYADSADGVWRCSRRNAVLAHG